MTMSVNLAPVRYRQRVENDIPFRIRCTRLCWAAASCMRQAVQQIHN